MRSLTLLLIPLIFLSSCTIDWNDEKDAFQKGKDCLTMTPQFEKKYNHKNILEEKVVDVFYSKKIDTCVVEVDYEGLKRVTFDGFSSNQIKYHMKGWETPTTLCTPEQRQDGCLDKDEWDKYIQGL